MGENDTTMINLKERIKKYWWVIPAIAVLPVIAIVYLYLRSRDKSKKMFEEYLKP